MTLLEESFAKPVARGMFEGGNAGSGMAGFYVFHNVSIGLQCFAFGLLLGIGGLYVTFYNAAMLGAAFGFMARSPHAGNFYQFVTAHGPFELTAVVLCAAAGLRLGFSLVDTQGLTRAASLRQAATESRSTVWAAVVLFVLAAMIEAFLSPSAAPYAIKAAVADAVVRPLGVLLRGVGLSATRNDSKMQLDHNRIVIRERGLLDQFDLALCVIRALRRAVGDHALGRRSAGHAAERLAVGRLG